MIDYLEEALDNAQALLEQVRRLERRSSGEGMAGTAEPDWTAGADAGREEGELRRGEAGGSGRSSPEGWTPPGTRPVELALEGEREAPEDVQQAPEPSAPSLLEQLEALERAAVRPALAGLGRDRSGGPLPPAGGAVSPRTGTAFGAGPEEGRGAGSAAAQGGALWAESLRWAEQADRVFRRDSRRYDGSFYLY